jgi:hypothetical protein
MAVNIVSSDILISIRSSDILIRIRRTVTTQDQSQERTDEVYTGSDPLKE